MVACVVSCDFGANGKMKAENISALLDEAFRQPKESGRSWTGQEPARSQLNEYWINPKYSPDGERPTPELVDKALAQLQEERGYKAKKARRKDAVLVRSLIVQATPERWFPGAGHYDNFTDRERFSEKGFLLDEAKAWAHDITKWAQEKFGDQLLSVTTHFDESSPHIHIHTLPVTADGRLAAKEQFSKKDCSKLLDELAQISKPHGLERAIEGGSKNREINEFRREQWQAAREARAAFDEQRKGLHYIDPAEGSRYEITTRPASKKIPIIGEVIPKENWDNWRRNQQNKIEEAANLADRQLIKLDTALEQALMANHSLQRENDRLKRELDNSKRSLMERDDFLIYMRSYFQALDCDGVQIRGASENPEDIAHAWGKRHPQTKKFLPVKEADLSRYIAEMRRSEESGRSIYLTPRSEKWNYILVDDLKTSSGQTGLEGVRRFVDAGFKACVLIESSPDNYQAILRIPKHSDPDINRQALNRVTQAINHKYGDPACTAGIHPHRAPTFQNRKRKHQREDGSYPRAELIKFADRSCPATQDFFEAICREVERKILIDREERRQRDYLKTSTAELVLKEAADQAYWRAIFDVHAKDIQEKSWAKKDLYIALRLRACGHTQEQTAAIIEAATPRQGRDNHRWPEWARDKAAWAFSDAGTDFLRKEQKRIPIWRQIEKRGIESQLDREIERHPKSGFGLSM